MLGHRLFLLLAALLTLYVSVSVAENPTKSPTRTVPSAHTRHILVDTESEVDAIMDQLIEARDLLATFSEIAATKSKCPSGKKGGDLGWHREGMMVSEFDAVVFYKKIKTLYKVKTQYGWHIVYTTEKGEMEVEDTWHRFFVTHLNTLMPFLSPLILILIMYCGSRSSSTQKPGSKARASHILVKTEAEAEEIYKQLKESKEPKVLMMELAKQKSSCPSKNKGGDLGLFGRGQMVPAFEKVAFQEAVGSIHKVETQFGWHIVMVTDRIGEKFDQKPQETKKEEKKQQ